MIEDFIDSAALFSDIYTIQGMKIVLSGTDSLGFWYALYQELYDRAITIHTTFIPLREHSRLLGINSIDELFASLSEQEKSYVSERILEEVRGRMMEEKLNQTSRRFGKITKRCVLYRGEDTVLDNGIEYKNVEDYQLSLL